MLGTYIVLNLYTEYVISVYVISEYVISEKS